ncbi:MAG TPA: hypothetical protein VK611_17065 [Acidimicrobiales bacterium]|nr:hypothetical protein [Acidimicrobiales bacterium]
MTAVQAAGAYTHGDGFVADFPEASRCTASRRGSTERCRRPALYGSGVCALHGAGAPQVRAAQASRWLREQFDRPDSQLARWHRELCEGAPVDPYRALAELNTAAHWQVQVLASQLTDADYRGPTPAFLAYERMLDRAARVARHCADVQVSERYLNLAELQGATTYHLLTAAFRAVPSITPDQQREFGAALRSAFEEARRGGALEATGRLATPGQLDSQLPIRGATP